MDCLWSCEYQFLIVCSSKCISFWTAIEFQIKTFFPFNLRRSHISFCYFPRIHYCKFCLWCLADKETMELISFISVFLSAEWWIRSSNDKWRRGGEFTFDSAPGSIRLRLESPLLWGRQNPKYIGHCFGYYDYLRQRWWKWTSTTATSGSPSSTTLLQLLLSPTSIFPPPSSRTASWFGYRRSLRIGTTKAESVLHVAILVFVLLFYLKGPVLVSIIYNMHSVCIYDPFEHSLQSRHLF